jgi:hypothetical protein
LFANIIDLDKLELYNLKNINRKFTNKEVIKIKFRLLRLFGQVYNIVVYICRSSIYIDYFRKLARRIILIDNCI